jgi:hypothetical protein
MKSKAESIKLDGLKIELTFTKENDLHTKLLMLVRWRLATSPSDVVKSTHRTCAASSATNNHIVGGVGVSVPSSNSQYRVIEGRLRSLYQTRYTGRADPFVKWCADPIQG